MADNQNIIAVGEAYVVVIRRKLSVYTKHFAFRRFKNYQAALRAARTWRDRKLAELPPAERWSGPRPKSMANKGSGQPVGVSRFISGDGRLRFSVNWVDAEGKGRIKTFSAGNAKSASPDSVLKAERAAHRFRRAYEKARREGAVFDPTKFNDWR